MNITSLSLSPVKPVVVKENQRNSSSDHKFVTPRTIEDYQASLLRKSDVSQGRTARNDTSG